MRNGIDRTICIAPMLDKTDRHYRYFARLLTQRALLYTEMITVDAILKGDAGRHLKYHPQERPLALQLGGNEAHKMAQCAVIAEDYGYDEINVNVGCPSDRAQAGQFGVCLMLQPERIAQCVQAMVCRVSAPVTVKTRIGVDNNDSYEQLAHFVGTVAAAGCNVFIIHARKAWLSGLSPKENRDIPPLQYATVYRLKADFPHLEIIINGGIASLADAAGHLPKVDGVMIGRAAYNHPFMLREVDQQFYAVTQAPVSRKVVLDHLMSYLEYEAATKTQIKHITQHILGLFHGLPNARHWRRQLTDHSTLSLASLRRIIDALDAVV